MRFAFYDGSADPATIDCIVDYEEAAVAAAHAASEGLQFVAVADDVALDSHVVSGGAAVARVPSSGEAAAALQEAVKALRKERRAAGARVVLPSSGVEVTVDTGPDDVAALTGAVVQARASEAAPSPWVTWPLNWKGGGSFYALSDLADLEALGAGAMGFVQAAYEAERAVLEAIEAGQVSTVEEVRAAFAAALG